MGLDDPNRPHYFVRQTAESFLTVGIQIFVLEPPKRDAFEVPKACTTHTKTNTRRQQRLKAMRRMRVNTNTL